MISNIAAIIGGIVLGLGATIIFFKGKSLVDIEKKQADAEELFKKSSEEKAKILGEARERTERSKQHFEENERNKQARQKKKEELLRQREANVQKREERLKQYRLSLVSKEEELQSLQEKTKRIISEIVEKLIKKTGLNEEAVKESIFNTITSDLEQEYQESTAKSEEKLKEQAPKIAEKILVQVMQRVTSPTSVENRAANVKVPKDHIKGKIVGRGGNNIAIFEEMLDVAIVFNDLPQTISLSAFNLVNRRIAQKAMQKLVKVKGEINKGVIEKAIKEAEKETDEELYTIGKKALKEIDMPEKNKELTRVVGRLKYRTSYGQNIMRHSLEVGWVAQMLGAEIGLDNKVAKVAGFLHDLGKAIDQDPDVKDAHDHLTKELMEKHGYEWEETHAAWTHHDAIPQETAEALLIKAADAVSASRPGARSESRYTYAERMEALVENTQSIPGVSKVQTMSAGREVRLYVDPRRVADRELKGIAKTAAKNIEENVVYPGKVKVNTIRRTDYYETFGTPKPQAKQSPKK